MEANLRPIETGVKTLKITGTSASSENTMKPSSIINAP
jgi:hypothetical protein